MKYPMRRSKQLLSTEETQVILRNGKTLTLALQGNEPYPYAVPVNYIWEENHLYFHCAKEGHKVEAMQYNPNVSFSILDKEEIIPEKYTTYFRSVIGFGKASKVENKEEIIHALHLLVEKYSPEYVQGGDEEIQSGLDHVLIIRIDIEEVSGKEAIELVREREATK